MRARQTEMFTVDPDDPNVRWLERLLLDERGWLTAAKIVARSGDQLNDRQIRQLASASPNIISGQRGYRHVDHSAIEELHHASAWLISQGKVMIKRGIRIKRRAHEKIR